MIHSIRHSKLLTRLICCVVNSVAGPPMLFLFGFVVCWILCHCVIGPLRVQTNLILLIEHHTDFISTYAFIHLSSFNIQSILYPVFDTIILNLSDST